MPSNDDVDPSESELLDLMRRTRLGASASSSDSPQIGMVSTPPQTVLPQQIFLQSMREEIEHFLAHADLSAEIEEERRLFEELRLLGEKVNACDVGDALRLEPSGPPLAWLKRALRGLFDPLFRLVLGRRLQRQSQLNTMLVQFQNALAQLQAQSVSVQRHYKAHQSNLSKNLLRVLDMLHQSELRLNEKIDLLVEDLDRQMVGLRRDIRTEEGETAVRGKGT